MSRAVTEHPLPPSRDGSVVLDIGGDIGAIVLHVPAAFADEELEIRRLDPSGPRTHTAVRERRVGRTSAYAAVYPALAAGTYRIDRLGCSVVVTGGEVTELSWP